MDADLATVIAHYESVREENRLDSPVGQLELLRSQEVLVRHLPPPPAAVLDVGGASGVHATWLTRLGYRVHLVDLSARHLRLLSTGPSGKTVTATLAEARELPVADGRFDVVLLMGPLYHLTNRHDRLRALSEARRVAKPGATIAVAAISRFASLFDGLAQDLLSDPQFRRMVTQDLQDGQHRNPTNDEHWFTTAYLHHPDDLRHEAMEAGLDVHDLVGLEGLAGYLPDLPDRWQSPENRHIILEAARAVEHEPCLLGLSAHLLLIATTPNAFHPTTAALHSAPVSESEHR